MTAEPLALKHSIWLTKLEARLKKAEALLEALQNHCHEVSGDQSSPPVYYPSETTTK